MLHGLLLAVVTGAMLVQASVAFADQPWLDTSQPPLERANELLAAMTFDPKVSLALNDFGSLSSLGIPQITADDGPSGIRADGTTSFPSAQTLASTFDRRLAWAYGAAIGNEARNKGFNEWLGPAMDIARTPLAGRQPENQGEDPFLAGNQVAEEVAGAKSQDVIATLKHYVGNNQEFQRFGFQTSTPTRGPAVNDIVSERALREIYEAPFQTAIKQGGADAVMCSYNRVNGQQTCESPFVLDPLKSSFQGFVVPDFLFAVRDPLAATLAGMDMPALPGFAGNTRTAAMFTSGQVPPARLDDIVRRVLFALFDSGAFDNPLPSPGSNVSTAAHQELATQVAQSGMVLLKNDDHALPLKPPRRGLRSLAVIGPSGEDAKFINGGSAAVPFVPGSETTPLAGITARAGSALQINNAQGSIGDAPLPTLVPSSVLAPSSGTGSGLSASYWSNGDFSGAPALTRVDPTVDLSGAPAGIGCALVGTVDGHAHSYRVRPARVLIDDHRHRPDLSERQADHLRLPRGDTVRSRTHLHGQRCRASHPRRAGEHQNRLLEQEPSVRAAGALQLAAAVGLADRRRGGRSEEIRRGRRVRKRRTGRGNGSLEPGSARRPERT